MTDGLSWGPNPFARGADLPPEFFVGRQEAHKALLRAWRSRASVTISGPRGIGKTTLARSLADLAGTRWVRVDASRVPAADRRKEREGREDLFARVLGELSLSFDLPVGVNTGRNSAVHTLLTTVVPHLRDQAGSRPVIVLDELDALDDAVVRHIADTLRRCGPRGPLWVFIVGEPWGQPRRAADVPTGDLDAIALQPLEPEAVEELFTRLAERGVFAIPPSIEGRPRVGTPAGHAYDLTGGYPLLLQALLEAVYEARWDADDRRPLSIEELNRLVPQVEADPPGRIRHALEQAGPKALRILYTLTEEGREALSAGELIDIFESEWRGWAAGLQATLEQLRDSGLLAYRDGAWTYRAPLLRGIVARFSRDEILSGERPPRADAWAAYRRGHDAERVGEVAEAQARYAEAAALDPDFWLPRWHHLRLVTARLDALDPLWGRHLTSLERLRVEVPAQHDAYAAIERRLCHAYMARVEAIAPGPERLGLLGRLVEVDPLLETHGARRAVAEEVVAGWFDRLDPSPIVWDYRAREVLVRPQLYLRPVTVSTDPRGQALARSIGEEQLAAVLLDAVLDVLRRDLTTPDPRAPGLVRSVLPIVLRRVSEHAADSSAPPADLATLFEWLERRLPEVPLHRRGYRLGKAAWSAFLESCPEFLGGIRSLVMRLAAAFEGDLRDGIEAGDGRLVGLLCEALARALGDVHDHRQAPAPLPAMVDALGDDLLEWALALSADDVERVRHFAEVLPRLLMPLGRWLPGGELCAYFVPIAEEVVRVRNARLQVSPAAHRAWADLPGIGDRWQGFRDRCLEAVSDAAPPLAADERLAQLRLEAAKLVGDGFELLEPQPIDLIGLRSPHYQDAISAWRAKESAATDPTARFLVRIFQLSSPRDEVRRVLERLWQIERQALWSVGTMNDGRALLRIESDRLVEGKVALMVTEWVGPRTLRDLIDESRTVPLAQRTGRRAFWANMLPVLEAVRALHAARLMHRSLTPQAIYFDPEAGWGSDRTRTRPCLRVGHFEWSVYLRGLQGLGYERRSKLGRWLPPEALHAALGIARRPRGETFASDLYTLGLTLFECLFGPFREEELPEYVSAVAYDEDAYAAHDTWLKGLRERAFRAANERQILPEERDILLKLLWADVQLRNAQHDAIIELARAICDAHLPDGDEHQLILFTPLSPSRRNHGADPRLDPTCIAFHLRRQMHKIDQARVDQLDTPLKLGRLIEAELAGAEILVNRLLHSHPLLLRTRSGLMFRLQPLDWAKRDGTSAGEVAEIRPRFAYLEYYRPHEGDGLRVPVVRLGTLGTPKLVDIMMPDEVNRTIGAASGDGWAPYFVEVDRLRVKESGDDPGLGEARASLLGILQSAIDIERELAWEEVPFRVVHRYGDQVTLQHAELGERIVPPVSMMLEADLHVELALPGTRQGRGINVPIMPEDIDLDQDLVTVRVAADRVPETGVLRASGNIGIQALYRRRSQILRQVEDDVRLLDTVIDPPAAARPRPVRHETEFFVSNLDGDKQRLVEHFSRVGPLLAVQGPPGTGKTTMATEILLQLLVEISGARALITTQGHDPLDNLLSRLQVERSRNKRAAQLLDSVEIVRAESGRRQPEDYPAEVRPFLATQRAQSQFEQMRLWLDGIPAGRAGLEGRLARELRIALSDFATAPSSLRLRIERSANLIFATANSRLVERSQPRAFDLVLFEEAARSVPIEVLGAMRLGERWLLIGDHHQLPPFGFEHIKTELVERLSDRVDDTAALDEAVDTASGADRITARALLGRQALVDRVDRYMGLFKTLHASRTDSELLKVRESLAGPAVSVRPSNELDGAPDAEPPRMSGTLTTQWRMHPDLGSMVSEVFYGGRSVRNPTGDAGEALRQRCTHDIYMPPQIAGQSLVWVDFDREPDLFEQRGPGGQLGNDAERRTTVALLRGLQRRTPRKDIAILSPYRAQVEQFRGLLDGAHNWFQAFGESSIQDRVSTIDAFQGRQASIVVISLVRNNDCGPDEWRRGVGFLADPRRSTVMFSRAENLLIVLGCADHFRQFKQTQWIMDVHSRAAVIRYTSLLPAKEIEKIRQRRHRRLR